MTQQTLNVLVLSQHGDEERVEEIRAITGTTPFQETMIFKWIFVTECTNDHVIITDHIKMNRPDYVVYLIKKRLSTPVSFMQDISRYSCVTCNCSEYNIKCMFTLAEEDLNPLWKNLLAEMTYISNSHSKTVYKFSSTNVSNFMKGYGFTN
jgi:hypothetical protein